MTKKYDVTALGEVLIDFACREIDEKGYPLLKANPGGAPCNFLTALSAYGLKTAIIAKVGNDTFGQMLINTLQEKQIDTSAVVVDDDVFTTLAFVTFDPSGDRSFSFARKPGADIMLKESEVNEEMIANSKVFHFGTLSLTDEPAASATCKAVAYARECGCLITFDPNLRKPLWKDLNKASEAMEWGLKQADVVKISDEEVDFLWGLSPAEGAEKILKEFGVKLVFVTLGPDGCYFAKEGVSGSVGGIKVNCIDTTGAGDIFGGSALSRILKLDKRVEELSYGELVDITSFAVCSASLSTEVAGGITSVQSEEKVLNRLKK